MNRRGVAALQELRIGIRRIHGPAFKDEAVLHRNGIGYGHGRALRVLRFIDRFIASALRVISRLIGRKSFPYRIQSCICGDHKGVALCERSFGCGSILSPATERKARTGYTARSQYGRGLAGLVRIVEILLRAGRIVRVLIVDHYIVLYPDRGKCDVAALDRCGVAALQKFRSRVRRI